MVLRIAQPRIAPISVSAVMTAAATHMPATKQIAVIMERVARVAHALLHWNSSETVTDLACHWLSELSRLYDRRRVQRRAEPVRGSLGFVDRV